MDGPSRTAQVVAVVRAGLDRPASPAGDPGAQRRLCAGLPPVPDGILGPGFTERTAFFDRAVLDALADSVTQVVVCGAGYDDRALRFATPGVRFFELDHPATQLDKARRLAALGGLALPPVLVPVDLGRDAVGAALEAAGHDAARPTLFTCEGLLVYLPEGVLVDLLAALAGRAAPGSRLAASLALVPDGVDGAAAASTANARRPGGASEPWRTLGPARDQEALLRRGGWQVVEAQDVSPTVARTRGWTRLARATPVGRP
jgi:methyltransferase (TIGR00027 family)